MGNGMKTYLMIETDGDTAVQLTKLAEEKGMSVNDYAKQIIMESDVIGLMCDVKPSETTGFIKVNRKPLSYNPEYYEIPDSNIDTQLTKSQVIALMEAIMTYMLEIYGDTELHELNENDVKRISWGLYEYLHVESAWKDAMDNPDADWTDAPDMKLIIDLLHNLLSR